MNVNASTANCGPISSQVRQWRAGIAMLSLAAVAGAGPALAATSGQETLLQSFVCKSTAYTPRAGIVQDSAGNIYGTTADGTGSAGTGTLYKITPAGTFSILYTFGAKGSSTAGTESGGVEFVTGDGSIFGIAVAASGNVVYKLGTGGSYTALHSFANPDVNGDSPDGSYPVIMLGSDGLIHGVAESGGTNGMGTLFQMAQDGSGFQLLHSFTAAEGSGTSLIQGSDGNWYGTTGKPNVAGSTQYGMVFKYDTATMALLPLHAFDSTTTATGLDGMFSDGNLYGSVVRLPAGSAVFLDNVFRMAPNGSNYLQGADMPPTGAGETNLGALQLVQTGNDRIYGYTTFGGSRGVGSIFSLSTADLSTATLLSFQSQLGTRANKTGDWPWGLIAGDDGNLYGSTQLGGQGNGKTDACGTVFKFVPPAN